MAGRPAVARDVALAIAVMVLGFACGRSDEPGGNEPGRSKVTIAQRGSERYLIYLPLYVAIEEGYFRDAGVDVDLHFTGKDDPTQVNVVRGHAQFGIGECASAAIAQEAGHDVKLVATIVGTAAVWGLTRNPEVREINGPEDLKGLRVGTFPAPSASFALLTELISKNSQLSSTSVVPAPIGAEIPLLATGRVDIALAAEPAASRAEQNGFRVACSSAQLFGPFPLAGVTVAQSTIESRPDLVRGVVGSLERAVVECHRDPELAIRVASKLFRSDDAAAIRNAVRRMVADRTLPEHVATGDAAWQAALALHRAIGAVSETQATSVSVDNTFAEAAARGD